MRINKQDTQGTKPLLGKGELGYDDYTAGGDTGRVYVGTSGENIPLAERLEANLMTKAQFNALAEERKANRAGSGFDEFGKHENQGIINTGMYTQSSISTQSANIVYYGRMDSSGIGTSKTGYPIINMNGNNIILKGTEVSGYNVPATLSSFKLPTAPNIYPYNTVLTTEQIASGVIKHADSSNSGLVVNGKGLSGNTFTQTITVVNGKKYIIEYKDNGVRKTLEVIASSTSYNISLSGTNITEVGMYPLDAISRSDLVFLESWHEDISEKNFVYPLGNVQYLGADTDGLTGIANGAFTGFETYSLFGNWQTPSGLIGKGYVWSSLTEAQRKAFIANPENNCYLDGDKVIQVRYRIRVVQGWGDDWLTQFNSSLTSSIYSSTARLASQGKSTISTALDNGNPAGRYVNSYFAGSILAGNSGLWNEVAQTNGYTGTTVVGIPLALVHRRNQGMYHPVYNANGSKKASDGNFWYNTSVSFTSISDCFDQAKLLTASGYIGTVSGRPDGLFYDQVHESDILDLRNSSKKVEDYNRLISREFNKLVAGTTRGKDSGWEVKYYFSLNITAISPYVWQGFTSYKFATTPPVEYMFGNYAGINHDYKAYYINGSSITEIYAVQSDGYFFIRNPTVSSGYVVIAKKSTRTKSNTLLHCDIIGNPTNYPTSWKESGVFGTPLVVAEDGTSLLPDGAKDTFKLSRKAKTTPLLCLRSTDNGVTWTSFAPTFSTTTNEITLTNEPTGNLVIVYYQTKPNLAEIITNSELLEIGKVFSTNNSESQHGAYLTETLLKKVPVWYGKSEGYPLKNYEIFGNGFWVNSARFPIHEALTYNQFGTSNPAVKVLPYLTRINGKAYLNLVYKELKHNGTSWGDDNKFNTVNNVSTTTDNNAQTVLIGQKTVELPYFIAGDE